jgi:aminopeptidase C
LAAPTPKNVLIAFLTASDQAVWVVGLTTFGDSWNMLFFWDTNSKINHFLEVQY